MYAYIYVYVCMCVCVCMYVCLHQTRLHGELSSSAVRIRDLKDRLTQSFDALADAETAIAVLQDDVRCKDEQLAKLVTDADAAKAKHEAAARCVHACTVTPSSICLPAFPSPPSTTQGIVVR